MTTTTLKLALITNGLAKRGPVLWHFNFLEEKR